jgi:dienelactone hydrolase
LTIDGCFRTLAAVQAKKATDIPPLSSIGQQTAAARHRPWLAVGLALFLAACTFKPAGTERLVLSSRDYGFVDELLAGDEGTPVAVDGYLLLPGEARFAPPYPALVMLHTSGGQGTQDWSYAGRFAELGLAVLAVDSFSGRGVSKTIKDPTLVGAASMLADGFAALAALRADPRIDPRRIGIIGFSKGAITALYAAYEPIRRRLAPGSAAFAAHLAYYPWCGLRLNRPVTTGAPVLIQSGALDDVVLVERCQELISASRGPSGAPEMELVIHAEARHGFDHPLLSPFGALPMSAPAPTNCLFQQQPSGGFTERHSGLAASVANLREVLALCSADHGTAGGNDQAAAESFARTLDFLRRAGFIGVAS